MVFLAQALEKYSFERPLSSGFTVLESEKTNLVAFLYFTAARINYTLVRYSKLLNLDKKMSHGRVDRLEKEQSRLTRLVMASAQQEFSCVRWPLLPADSGHHVCKSGRKNTPSCQTVLAGFGFCRASGFSIIAEKKVGFCIMRGMLI